MKGSLAAQMATINQSVATRMDQVVRKIALDIGTRLVEKSPVGNPSLWKHPAPKGYVGGHFRANWQMQINHPADGAVNAIDPNGSATIAAMTAMLSGARAGGNIFITNNLPYARRLEYGHHSSQAPAGMVGITVVEFSGVVTQAIREVA